MQQRTSRNQAVIDHQVLYSGIDSVRLDRVTFRRLLFRLKKKDPIIERMCRGSENCRFGHLASKGLTEKW